MRAGMAPSSDSRPVVTALSAYAYAYATAWRFS
jgi:hypothetical protein